jgi:uncharacterized membrane protein
MNQYPLQYDPQQNTYYPAAQYWTTQFEELIPIVVGIATMIAVAAWAFSLLKKAFKGEEVKFPL